MQQLLSLIVPVFDQSLVQHEVAHVGYQSYPVSGLHWQRQTSQNCQPFCAKERSPGSQESDNVRKSDLQISDWCHQAIRNRGKKSLTDTTSDASGYRRRQDSMKHCSKTCRRERNRTFLSQNGERAMHVVDKAPPPSGEGSRANVDAVHLTF